MGSRIVQKTRQRGGPSRPADKTAMQANRHHSRHLCAFTVKQIKSVLQVNEKLFSTVEALVPGESLVVCIECVGDDQMRPAVGMIPIGYFVGVAVRIIMESAFLDDQPTCVRTHPPSVPAQRPLPG